ncbi:MAG: hypothetical protein U1D97_09835 [Desulfuromonadales bacterium]|nr:hypothetical protein [Desulfuromonadales bacterium]
MQKELLAGRDLKGRFAELAVGLTATNLIGYAFDYLLYPFIVYQFGILQGGIIMTFVSFTACIAGMKFYDWSKRDWFGIEAIKKIKTYKGTRTIGHAISWVLRKNETVVFLFLSIKFDPFVTTAYMRHGKFNGMNQRDWTIFMGSLIVSNIYWTLACYMGISLAEWGWKTISGGL